MAIVIGVLVVFLLISIIGNLSILGKKLDLIIQKKHHVTVVVDEKLMRKLAKEDDLLQSANDGASSQH